MNKQDLLDLGVEAYIFLYPLITMDVTRRVMTNAPAGVKPGIGPMGAFQHMRAFPEANFKAAKERCDALSGDAKSKCVDDMKRMYNKS